MQLLHIWGLHIHAPDLQFLKFFLNPRMEMSPSLWTSPWDAMAVTPSQLCPFHILISLAALPSPHALEQPFAEHHRQGGRLVGAALSSVSAPFLLHHNPFSFSMFWLVVAGKHPRPFSSVKSNLILTFYLSSSQPQRCFLCCFCVPFCTLDKTPTLLPP